MQTSVAAHASQSEDERRVQTSVFVAYAVAATLWLLFATAVGVVLAYKFGAPDFAPGEWLTFGRLRPIHTNATLQIALSAADLILATSAVVVSLRT